MTPVPSAAHHLLLPCRLPFLFVSFIFLGITIIIPNQLIINFVELCMLSYLIEHSTSTRTELQKLRYQNWKITSKFLEMLPDFEGGYSMPDKNLKYYSN